MSVERLPYPSDTGPDLGAEYATGPTPEAQLAPRVWL